MGPPYLTSLFTSGVTDRGCGARHLRGSGADWWTCTDHLDRVGDVLHIAATSNGKVCGLWVDEARFCDQNSNVTLKDALAHFDELFPMVSDEEVQDAAAKLQRLLESMQ